MINKKQILAVIPARGGSKSIPQKNIALLCGKPLIVYSIESARQSRYINRIIVSTDDKEIAAVARAAGAEVPFLRPREISQDLTPDLPVFEHCLAWLKENAAYVPDIIVHLRPTGPLRTAVEIDEAIELLENYPEADSMRSVEEPPKPPYKMWKPELTYIRPFVEDLPGLKDAHTAPRQMLPKVYQTTADIGIFRIGTILNKKSIIGDRVLPYHLKRPTVDIDTKFDLEIAEYIINKRESDQ